MKQFRFIFFVLFSLLVLCGFMRRLPINDRVWLPPGYGKEMAATFYYTEGLKYAVIGGDREGSNALYMEALRRDSLHAPSYYGLAGNLAQTDLRQAIRYASKAWTIDTTNIYYQTQLGRLYLMNKDYDRALITFQDVLRREPQDPDNYRIVAALYRMNGQPFSAVTLLDSAEVRIGRTEELAAYKRQLLIETKQYNRAISQANAMVEAFPYNVDNYLSLADIYGKTGKDSLALANYNKALEIDSTNVDVIASMNDFYKEREDMPNFVATTRKLFNSQDVSLENKITFLSELKGSSDFFRANFSFIRDLSATLAILYPDRLEALMEYVRVLVASDNSEEAAKLLKNFLWRSEKPDLETLNDVIGLELFMERPDSVDKYMSLALRKYPRNFDLRVQKAMIQAEMKQNDKALHSYKEALKLVGDDSTRGAIYGCMGDLYHSMGNHRKTYNYYDRSLRKYYDNAMVLNNYAYYLAEEHKRLDKALKMSRRSMELMKGTPSFIDTYAWVLYRRGDYDQARKAIKQAISLDRRESPELAFHYGEILYALKDYFMASVYWQKALERGYDKAVIEQRLKLVEGK